MDMTQLHPHHKDIIKELYFTQVDFFFHYQITLVSFHRVVLFQVEEWHGSNNLCNSHDFVNFVSLALTLQAPGLREVHRNYANQSAASTPQLGYHKGAPHIGGFFHYQYICFFSLLACDKHRLFHSSFYFLVNRNVSKALKKLHPNFSWFYCINFGFVYLYIMHPVNQFCPLVIFFNGFSQNAFATFGLKIFSTSCKNGHSLWMVAS